MRVRLNWAILVIFIAVVYIYTTKNYSHLINKSRSSSYNQKKASILADKNFHHSEKLENVTLNSSTGSTPIQNDNDQNQSVTSYDEFGSRVEVVLDKKTSLWEKIRANERFSPEEEINNLYPINFLNNESGLFSGNFIDENNIKLSLTWAGEDGLLSQISCIKIQNDDIVINEDSSIKVFDDHIGYAVLLVKKKYFLRMAYVFDPHRMLIGRIYVKDKQWKFLSEFKAREDNIQVLGRCPY